MSARQRHETAFLAMAARKELSPGQTYMVDPISGLVTCATVWLHGDVWFFDHYDRDHKDYEFQYLSATHESRASQTLFARVAP